jgi:hypothetical protein
MTPRMLSYDRMEQLNSILKRYVGTRPMGADGVQTRMARPCAWSCPRVSTDTNMVLAADSS